jgi:hypothetical protein
MPIRENVIVANQLKQKSVTGSSVNEGVVVSSKV